MRTLRYTVPEDWDGAAVRDFARKYLGLSAAAFKAQKYEGGILVNGIPRHADALLRAGDALSLPLAPEPADYPPADLPVGVVYEDEDYLLADKPPGMPVHPSPGHDRDSLLNAAAFHFARTGRQYRVRPLYRLDKDTSGLVLVAKNLAAAGAALEKEYWAVCGGRLEGEGTVDCPIGLAPGSKILRRCGAGQRAVTHWTALAGDGGYTLLSLRLETGRTHQIRAHMAYIGHPLAGDELYGGSREALGRQALHCARLSVSCRALAFRRTFQAGLPADLRAAFPWAAEYIRKHGLNRA